MPRFPRLSNPLAHLLDAEDRRMLGIVLVLSALVVWAAVVLAVAAGLAVRVFLAVS